MTTTAWIALLLLVFTCLSCAAEPMHLHVSPQGRDTWSGRPAQPSADGRDGPLATLRGARDAIRKWKDANELDRPVVVLIADGVYRVDATVDFTPADSGSADCPITYAAAPGARPVISGGRLITGFRQQGGHWVAKVPGVQERQWYFHQLFVGDQRRTRARTPNAQPAAGDPANFFRTAGPLAPLGDRNKARGDATKKVGFRYREGDLKPWDDLTDANLWVYHSWTASLHWIKELDEKQHTVRFTNRSGWPIGWWEAEQRYYLENCMAALDAPGEWYLDRRRGELHYIPLPGEDLTRVEVVAPVVTELVSLTGEPEVGLFVEHLNFRGISFQHTDWRLPREQVADGQAAAFLKEAAIHARGTRHCTFSDCEVAHVGGYAVWFGAGCKDNRLERSELRDMGAGGVRIGETSSPASPTTAAERNVVDNCFIHGGGRVFPAGIGAWIGRSSYNTISHCEIADFYYTGISVGWSWGYAKSSANHNVIDSNRVHHIGAGVLSDMGGIYTLGNSPGTRCTNNVFHDIYSYSYGGWGLYTDEGSSGILFENNLVYNTKTGGFHQHYGRDNIIRNNILAFADQHQIQRSREEDHNSFDFERNIIYYKTGALLGGRWGNDHFRIDHNLYWNAADPEDVDFAGVDLDEWQDRGHDAHSIIADPLFVDADSFDFRLRPDSPAKKIGFQAFDYEKAGLYGDPAWVQRPRKVTYAPISYPPVPQQRTTAIHLDFEDVAVGEQAPGAHTSGETEVAQIRVTDEVAASGRRCLRIVDAPNLSHEWQPHIYWSPSFRKGVVKASFDLRITVGAKLYHEWRDSNSPYRTGPSIHVEPNGEITANGKPVVHIEPDQWVHIEIVCPLGKNATGHYELTVSLPGREPQVMRNVPCGSPQFRALTWFGFVSTARDRRVFFLDNVHLDTVK